MAKSKETKVKTDNPKNRMIVHCKADKMIPIKKIIPHDKNRNKHTPEQIERLAALLSYQGIRAPLIISKLSGKLCKGHATLEAIKLNGWLEAPVVYQNFKNEDQEYGFVQSDNAIGQWSQLDLKLMQTDLKHLDHKFDLNLLGIENFKTPHHEHLFETEDKKVEEKGISKIQHQCPRCKFKW